MGRNKIDRIGEVGYNNFGNKMIITRYQGCEDIDVYFPKYDWTFKHSAYKEFKNGNIKCPYEPRVYNHGYIGEGEYKTWENDKTTKCYNTWHDMLRRCYDSKLHKRHPTYINCEVEKRWLDYQDFGNWFEDNYYEVKDEKMHLDKDILNKGNKIYSPDTCVFVPHNINILFTKRNKSRGDCPIGVTYDKRYKKFHSQCSVYDYEVNKSKVKHLGLYDTPEQAFEVYKRYKEKYIKQVADYYKDQIPDKLYNAMYNYEVEITD